MNAAAALDLISPASSEPDVSETGSKLKVTASNEPWCDELDSSPDSTTNNNNGLVTLTNNVVTATTDRTAQYLNENHSHFNIEKLCSTSTKDDDTDEDDRIVSNHAVIPCDVGGTGRVTSSPVNQTNAYEAQSNNGATAKRSVQDQLLKNIASDAVSIFAKYIAKDATHPIGVPEDLRLSAIRKICGEDGQVDAHSFVPCQQFAVQLMQTRYHADFLRSDFNFKHQVDILTSCTAHLADILYNDCALSYFMQYMEQEKSILLLQCWLDLENFQQFLTMRVSSEYDWSEAQSDAMVLYDKYFSLQATQPLGFDDKIRFEVEINICREGGPLPDCFSDAKNVVTKVLNEAFFPQFLQNDVYYKYLSDLINSVQLAQDVPSMMTLPRKRKGSGSGSEHSTSSNQSEKHNKNTLLAGARKVKAEGVSKAVTKLEPNMQMDTTLFNPDSLWQRSQSQSGLSLAKIDEMGRFLSDFEVNPDSDKHMLSDLGLFKRSRDKELEEEAMALQVANMIIADITTTTQQSQHSIGQASGGLSSFKSEPVPK